MNAPSLPVTALDNEAVLRHLHSFPGADHASIGLALDRRSDTVLRSFRRMAADGLITHDAAPALTEAGRRALAALDVAAGRRSVGDGARRALRHDQIASNPDNDRTVSGLTDDSIDEMARTLDLEGFLEDPRVRARPDAEGRHVLMSGERRWRAWGRLIEQGRWSADKTVDCILDDSDDERAEIRALIANIGRVDIDNLEAAEGYLRLATRYNLDAGEIAARIGKVDKRQVLYALKVAREATPEDKAAYRASEAAHAADRTVKRTFTWTRLRQSVQDRAERPPLELSPAAAAALGEIWLIARRSTPEGDMLFAPLKRDIVNAALVDLTSRGLALFVTIGDVKGLEPIALSEATDWLAFIKFDDDPQAAVERLQAAVVGELLAAKLRADGLFVTPAFNPPDPKPDAVAPAPTAPPATGAERRAPIREPDPAARPAVDEGYYAEALRLLSSPEGKASTSWLQRKMQLNYNTGAALMERLERAGVVSMADIMGKRTINAAALAAALATATVTPDPEPGPSPSAATDGAAPAPAPDPASAQAAGAAQSSPPETAAPNPSESGADRGDARLAPASPTPSKPAGPSAMQRLILVELWHRILTTRDGHHGLKIDAGFYRDEAAQAAVAAGLIDAGTRGDGALLVTLTDEGEAAVLAMDIVNVPTPTQLDAARRAAHWPREDGQTYATAWLNYIPAKAGTDTPPPAAATPVRDPFPMPFQLILVRTQADAVNRANGEPHDVTEIGMADETAAHDFAEDLIAAGLAVEIEVRAADGTLLFHFDKDA